MTDLLEFKCPNCGGKLEFDASAQKMKCPYCDSELDIEALRENEEVLNEVAREDNMNWDSTPEQQWENGESGSLNVYVCRSCAGEIVADETTGATHCPYCGNPVVMASKFAGTLRPDYVIPFSVSKEEAKQKLRQHYKGKKLLPKVFSSENHLDEIKGLYVPFWLFDATSDASVSYKMTNVRSWSDGSYNYTETMHYAGYRQGRIAFSGVPVDGSSKMPDDLMESIEPFDASAAVPFNTAYLSGFLADKYDVDEASSLGRANERIKRSTEDAFRSTVTGYTSVNVNDSHIDLSQANAKYALYPVWLLTTTFNKQQYLFAVNGQTGKIVGDLPVDKSLATKYRAIYTLLAGAASYAVIWLFMHFGGLL